MNSSMLHRRESLILTAIEVIDELGIQGLSTREIAKRQGVSEATMFRHYRSKNELLLAVLNFYARYDVDVVEKVNIKQLPPRKAIEHCIDTLLEYYESYPAITAIGQIYDALSCDEAFVSKLKSILSYRISFLSELIERAKEAGELGQQVDSEGLAEVIIGYCRQSLLTWRMSGFSHPMKEKTLAVVRMILDALQT